MNGIFITIKTLIMGVLYRMSGGLPPKLPWKLDQVFVALALTLPLAWVIDLHVWNIVGMVIAGVLSAFDKSSGHGQWFLQKFPRNVKGIDPEFFDFLIRPFFGRDPRTIDKTLPVPVLTKMVEDYGVKKLYWRCFAGMFVSNALVVLPPAILLGLNGFWVHAAITTVLIGFVKPLWYTFGYRVLPAKKDWGGGTELDEPTEIGEAGSGLATGLIWSIMISLIK